MPSQGGKPCHIPAQALWRAGTYCKEMLFLTLISLHLHSLADWQWSQLSTMHACITSNALNTHSFCVSVVPPWIQGKSMRTYFFSLLNYQFSQRKLTCWNHTYSSAKGRSMNIVECIRVLFSIKKLLKSTYNPPPFRIPAILSRRNWRVSDNLFLTKSF